MSDFMRSFPLLDLSVRAGGDGRTVEAYAAVFDVPVDIADAQGRYREQIARTAFDQAIARRQTYPVLFNHGMTPYGTPSDKWSAPIGVTTELRKDSRGLVSVWRADETANGDEVLTMINSGSLTSQSFAGRFTESTPKMPRGGYGPDKRTGELPLVTRSNVFLRELGPAVFAAYEQAVIIGTRMAELASRISGLDPEERAELARLIAATPEEGQVVTATPDHSGPGAEDQPFTGHSGRLVPSKRTQEVLAASHKEIQT